jgi:hypothetical protein
MIRPDGPSLCDLPRWAVGRKAAEMPLEPRSLNSVVRVSSAGTLLGTGSLVSVPSETLTGVRWGYVVTAHHVIRNQVMIELEVPDPLSYGQLFPPVQSDDWRQPFPNVDLAVAPFLEGVPRIQSTPLTHFVPKGTAVPLGGELFYLGVFTALDVPMARAATLGALRVPIKKDQYQYVADLVDCRSYVGFSGSPCFSVIEYTILDGEPPVLVPEMAPRQPDGTPVPLGRIGALASFCGMFTAHYSDETAAAGVVSRYGVGLMLPCDYIWEALMTDEAKAERREWDKTRKAAQSAELPPLENAGGQPVEAEWDRFENLTEQLLHTPKSELDEKRKEKS